MGERNVVHANNRMLKRLLLATVFMFGFGFALVPLYNAMCDALGINGRFREIEQGTYDPAKALSSEVMEVDKSRTITVELLASIQRNGPWEFRAMVHKVKVHPGEIKEVDFYAKNLSSRAIVAQAIPSIVPGTAVKYFHKIECFCFHQQTFNAEEDKVMPLRFVVDPKLPRDISTISLGYTFFDTGKTAKIETERSGLASAQTVLSGITAKENVTTR
jgi:cytochrome c oxidase assembly protein subunit 11